MSAIDMNELASKMEGIFKKKKRNSENVGTGEKIIPPPFWIKAPDAIANKLNHYPGQRIFEISGKPNSGKTTLGMLAMVEAQKGYFDRDMKYVEEPINIILIDTEGKFSKFRFEKMGGDASKLFKITGKTLEQCFFALEETLKVLYSTDPNAKVLLVFDSVGGTPSRQEAEADADDTIQLATAAKVLKRNLRVFVPKWLDTKDICMLAINTSYQNIGTHGRSNSGGDGLEFAAAQIIQLGRVGDITKDQNGEKITLGITTRALVTKNHMQTKEYSVKEFRFEIYAYDVRAIETFKPKKGNEFVNDDGRLIFTKVSKKDKQIEYQLNLDDKENENHEKKYTVSYDEVKTILKDQDYDSLQDD